MRSHVETAKANGVEAHAYLTPVRGAFLRQHRRAVRSTVAVEYRHDYSTCLTQAIASFLYSDLNCTTGSASHRKHLDFMADVTHSRPGQAQVHFRELDGMRGVLALTVLVFHFGLNTVTAQLTRGRIHDGVWGLSVDFFFVLSGFVICRSFVRRPVGLAGYAIKRSLRLAPIFLITTIFVLCLKPRDWDPITILGNLLIVQSLVGLKSINFPSWSIPFELVLPALGLVLVAPGMKLGKARLVIVVVVLLVAQSAAAAAYAAGTDIPCLRAGTGLGLGGAMYLLRHQGAKAAGPGTLISALAFVGALAVMAVTGVIPKAAFLFPCLSAAAIWWGAGATGLFSTQPTQALGRWSYSIYMAHIPVLLCSQGWLGDSLVRGWYKLALAVVAISFAALAFRFVEAPLMHLGERLVRP